MDEICDKYGLEVLGPFYTEDYAIDVVKAVGIDNLFADTVNVPTSLCDGYYYRGGTFQLSGETTLNYEDSPWIYQITYQYRCVMKNAFDEVHLPVDALEDFDEWNYCLGDGTEVLLALSAEQALVIVDKEEFFVTINVLETREGDVLYGEQHMSREGLESFAETFNFDYEIERPNPETWVPPEWFEDPESGESEFIENNVSEETDYENKLAKKVYEYLLSGDRQFWAGGETEKWWIPEFHEWSMTYEYTYLDLDGDSIVELLVQMIDSPCEYNGVFHYEEGQVYCWNSDAMEMSCRDYPLSDGTMVRQLEFGENNSYTIFRYTSDGEREEISSFLAREELLTEDSSEPCPYYEIDGNEVSKSVFDEELKMMIQERILEKSAWIELVMD